MALAIHARTARHRTNTPNLGELKRTVSAAPPGGLLRLVRQCRKFAEAQPAGPGRERFMALARAGADRAATEGLRGIDLALGELRWGL